MIVYILIGIYFFSSLGIFLKLRKYGAPISSFLYSGVVPLSALMYVSILMRDSLKNSNKSNIEKVIKWISFEIMSIKYISIITALFCMRLGMKKVGFFDLYRHGLLKSIKRGTILIKEILDEIFSINPVGTCDIRFDYKLKHI